MWHCSLSLHPQEPELTDDRWAEICEQFISERDISGFLRDLMFTLAQQTSPMSMLRTSISAASAYDPDGLNLGANLGRAAGAGIPSHVHVHVLPRWSGDTNFMTSIAEVRVPHDQDPKTPGQSPGNDPGGPCPAIVSTTGIEWRCAKAASSVSASE